MTDKEQKNGSFNYDYIVVIVLYVWSLVYFLASRSIDSEGARLFPYVVMILTVVLATILLVKILFGIGRIDAYDFSGTGRAVALMGMMLIYVTAVTYLGFYIATPFFLYIAMFVLGQRNHKVMIISAILLPLFVFLLFDLTLNLQVPTMSIF